MIFAICLCVAQVMPLDSLPPASTEGWLSSNWFNLTQTVGIIAGLLVAAAALRADLKARRAEAILNMTQYHRDIWGRVFEDAELARVLQSNVNLAAHPITPKEELLCKFL